MATEFTVIVEDKPGTLARLGRVLGDASPWTRPDSPIRRARCWAECCCPRGLSAV
jgi:hypothetical protein